MTYIRHNSVAVEQAVAEIKNRQNGKIEYISTSVSKIDDSLLGGLEPWRIVTIAGLSGSGKSTFMEQLVDNFFVNGDPRVLNFSFEMLGKDSMLRLLSKRLNLPVKDILKNLNTKDPKFIEAEKALKERDYFIVDEVLTIEEIENVIIEFVDKAVDKFNIITLDHTLLCKGNKGHDIEKAIIDELYRTLIRLKKRFFAEGKKVSFIVLSQLNREIEQQARIVNQNMQYPNKNDMFAASSAYYSSDNVFVLHCPANISSMGQYYGPVMKNFPRGLPTKINNNKIVYLHMIKTRFSAPNRIVPFIEEFNISKLTEIELIDDNHYKII